MVSVMAKKADLVPDAVKVELPILSPSKILSSFHTIGDLQAEYPTLRFIKYIFRDPKDQKLTGANPPSDLPLVRDAYITVAGSFVEVGRFTKDATSL